MKKMCAIPRAVQERASARYVEQDGCYVSTYSVAGGGYAQIGWWCPEHQRSHMTTAHQAAWTRVNGLVPDDLTIDHICHNRRCVRLECMRLLTRAENAREGQSRMTTYYDRWSGEFKPILSRV